MDGRQSNQTGISIRPERPQTKEQALELMKPLSELLDPQQEGRNAAAISFELDVVSQKLGRFGWNDSDKAEMRQRLTDDWTDALREFHVDEVRNAIDACLDDEPKRVPHERAVRAKVLAYRSKALAKLPKAPPPPEKPKGPRRDMSDIVASAFPDALTAQQIADREGK